jgi:hypothetical protein
MKKILTCSAVFLLFSVNAIAADVTLAWDANAEPVAGYRVHYGEVTNVYTTKLDAAKVTQFKVDGLTEGKTYYIAVTAYNDGQESDYSNEIAYTARPGRVTIRILDRPQEVHVIFSDIVSGE